MRKAFIKVVPGDEVIIELSPYESKILNSCQVKTS